MSEKPTRRELEQRIRALESEASECRRTEDALRESEAQYRSMMEAMKDTGRGIPPSWTDTIMLRILGILPATAYEKR